jgi:hypothetical protein
MAMLLKGRILVDFLLGDRVPLKDMMFGATIADGEQPRGLDRSSSGTRKWIKELSSLANVVVGHCAR